LRDFYGACDKNYYIAIMGRIAGIARTHKVCGKSSGMFLGNAQNFSEVKIKALPLFGRKVDEIASKKDEKVNEKKGCFDVDK
jgi:hypothetical protein